ncbi:hypothetical protein AR158_c238R [Paramecium bursaria Chlorella virus AR158]|uniref:hypothetical protein n=1 Tax=Paramecium bursaria Chlorella virus AR158 TaxID=380598 RepID=UPI00015AA8A2|nr:hypothetical protein AR158_c238R [Paramecium bursaria Chlorella virus AR158]ABU43783.1 hypothetical protein AR158_c238R [Paramecium bursaria Chlorella virus AR158]
MVLLLVRTIQMLVRFVCIITPPARSHYTHTSENVPRNSEYQSLVSRVCYLPNITILKQNRKTKSGINFDMKRMILHSWNTCQLRTKKCRMSTIIMLVRFVCIITPREKRHHTNISKSVLRNSEYRRKISARCCLPKK